MKTTKIFLPFIACLLAFNFVQAQGWEKKYSPDLDMGINSFYQLSNGTYLVSGIDTSGTKQRLISIDGGGDILWQNDYRSSSRSAHMRHTPGMSYWKDAARATDTTGTANQDKNRGLRSGSPERTTITA